MTHAINMPFSAASRKQREVFIAFRDRCLVQNPLFHLPADRLNLHEHCHEKISEGSVYHSNQNAGSPGAFFNFLTLEHFCQTES